MWAEPPDRLRNTRRARARPRALRRPARARGRRGHSAFNAILDLVALRESEPATQILWAIRGDAPGRKYGGGGGDQLPARGALGATVRRLVEEGSVELIAGFHTRSVTAFEHGLVL